MADWYPGAYRVDQGGNGNSISARPAENILHIAASAWNIDLSDPLNGSKGIAGWNASASACNGYVDQFGAMQQYCSVWSAVNGTKDGNWRNRSFHNYADHALGSEFADALAELRQHAAETPTAVMCSEAVWWRCHRRIIADHLIAHGDEVGHIMGLGAAGAKVSEATLNDGAVIGNDLLVRYPERG